MKLYFKDLSYETKYKWLEYYLKMDRLISSSRLYDEITKDFERGYIELDDYLDEYHDELKNLNIWKEPRESLKVGKFWDLYEDGVHSEHYVIGFYGGKITGSGELFTHKMVDSMGRFVGKYYKFEEITDLKELQ